MQLDFDDRLYDPETGEPYERFLPVEQLCVPEIELSDNLSSLSVVSDFEAYRNGDGPLVSVSTRCLTDFVELGDADPSVIRRFAKRWGMLGLCKHGEPAGGHGLRPREARLTASMTLERCGEQRTESISDWQRYAKLFKTVLELSSLIRGKNATGTERLWQQLPVAEWLVSRARDPQKQRRLLAWFINELLAAATIQITVTWNKRPALRFACRSRTTLFAALAFELAMTVAECRTAFCSYCHRPYQPERRPRAGEANSCKDCRQRANAERVRRSRDRKRTTTRKRNSK